MSENVKIYRMLRVLEYTGTREFIDEHTTKRFVKGTKELKSGTIREYILGDTTELLIAASSFDNAVDTQRDMDLLEGL